MRPRRGLLNVDLGGDLGITAPVSAPDLLKDETWVGAKVSCTSVMAQDIKSR